MILIDLQKAFDTADHQILLKKLNYIGFSPETLKWFESYLKNRNLIVSLEKSFSEAVVLNSGVPQGSILGLIIFLVYVNDMKSAVMIVTCDHKLMILAFSSEIKMLARSKNT